MRRKRGSVVVRSVGGGASRGVVEGGRLVEREVCVLEDLHLEAEAGGGGGSL